MVRQAISTVVDGQQLDASMAEAVMNAIMEGEATDAQIAALLTALRCRGGTVDELTGFARAMRDHATRVPTERRPLIDTCGTGGGGACTINASTAAALVAAGAGVAVAKHGNRAVTSRCGSADVLEALGIILDQPPAAIGRCIDANGIGFLFAPALHPAMRYAIAPRREIGIRTVFNLLGPVTNPAGAEAQVVGVPEPRLADLVIEVLANLGRRRAMVVHGLVGVDELSIEGSSVICELRDGQISRRTITPAEVGLREAPLLAVEGGDATANAVAIRRILEGEHGPARDFVLLNAAAAVVVGEAADDLREGVAVAAESIDSGRAMATLEAWRAWRDD
ncbi:MAG: anthranilate phosphoribosyltransferase [Armatimonadetes bacterium]|nr:anthranilate phosphoribosyltransferase [Armatimonadota bacterium]